LYWEHAGSKAVRNGKWKLEQVYKEPWELYNMAEDRSETNNLIAQYPKRAKKMEKLYYKWAKSHDVIPAIYH
jgi:arylsulfatase